MHVSVCFNREKRGGGGGGYREYELLFGYFGGVHGELLPVKEWLHNLPHNHLSLGHAVKTLEVRERGPCQ